MDSTIDSKRSPPAQGKPSLTSVLDEKQAEIKELQEQIRKLHEKFSQQKIDKAEVERQLKAENDRKLQQTIGLQNEIQQLEKLNEKNNNEINSIQLITKFETTIKDIRKKGDDKLQENDVKISELQENRNMMDDTQKKKMAFEIELSHWRNECAIKAKEIQEVKYKNQIELAKKKQRLEMETEAKLELFKQQAQRDAERNILDIEKNIHQENQKLTEKTVAQRYALDYRKREKQKLLEENKDAKRAYMLQLGTVDQYDQRGKAQQRKIKMLKGKIQVLEKSLGQIVEDFEKEKELVRYQHDQIIRDQKEEVINLREIMRSKNSELKKVKAISQVIIDQRSDVEQFFLEALAQIKEEIQKKISAERKQRRLNGQPFPPPNNQTTSQQVEHQSTGGLQAQATMSQGSSTQQDNQQKSYAEKVDLNDLDWEDRERVLRLLFSKMNAGVPANVQHIQQQLANARAQKAMGGMAGSHGVSSVSNEQLVAALEGSYIPAIQYQQE